MSLAEELRSLIHGEVADDAATLEGYARDASLFYVRPQVVVHPASAEDVAQIVHYAAREKERSPQSKVSVTARSAGTDMSGGPLNDSIILEMATHMNRLLELGKGYAVVEPGMYFRDFDKETEKEDLELPSYTASREINTVGGMVANNSGGEKNLKYGKTAQYVEELETVLSDGQVHTLKNLSGKELQDKCAEQSFEGEIYRRMAALLSRHQAVISAGKPHVEKNSSGYALWDMGDGVSFLNLARLMVGSQGTLGIITKIRFKLVHPEPYAAMVVVFLDSLSQLGTLVPEILKHSPDSFESYDDNTFKLAVKYFSEFAAQMKTGIVSLGLSFLPEILMLLRGGIPKLVLMVEFRGKSQEEALDRADRLYSELEETQPHLRVRIMESAAAAQKYWVIRRESFNLLRKKVRGKRTAPFIDDFVVPPQSLPQFLPKLEEILSHYHFLYTIAGHVGDGNFHIIPLVDPKDPTLGKTIDELSHKVYDLVISYHGSITGEHNDGLIRTPYVEKMFGPALYALFLETKKIFDPQNIFNPGKKVGGTYSDAFTHLDLPKTKVEV